MTEQPPTKTKTSIATGLWWLASIAFCVWSIMALTKGNMPAMMGFVGAAIFASPPVQAGLRKLMDPGMPRWLVALPAIGLVIAASVASGSAGSSAMPAEPTKEQPVDVVANVVRFQAAYIGASDGCKRAFQAVADEGASSGPRIQEMYNLAERAESQCRAAREVIGGMKTPVGLSPAESGAFQQAVLTCEAAYRQATDTADKLKEALDAGFQPSKVATYQQSATTAVAGRQSCEAQIATAAETAVANHRDRPTQH